MINALKLGHLVMPLLLGVIYIYFILLLNKYLFWGILIIVFLSVFMFIYGLRTYALLHFNPGKTKNMSLYKDCSSDKIFEYKRNEEKLKQLKGKMANKKIHQIIDVQKQYLEYYQQFSYCDSCQCTKPSRAYHCRQCNACILRRQKHSQLIGGCIGQGNMKAFIQYLFIAMITSAYMTITLLIVTVGEHHQLNEFNDLQLSIFAFQLMTLCASVLLFIKEFSISYYNAKSNITQTERQQNIINNKNNPFKDGYYEKLFQSNLDYLKINQIGDYNQWLEMSETS